MFLLNFGVPSIIFTISILIGIVLIYIAISISDDGHTIILVGLVAIALVFLIGVPVGTHLLYRNEMSGLESAERIAISYTLKKDIVSIKDMGRDAFFPQMRDVIVLTSGGDSDLYYYSQSTGKAMPQQ